MAGQHYDLYVHHSGWSTSTALLVRRVSHVWRSCVNGVYTRLCILLILCTVSSSCCSSVTLVSGSILHRHGALGRKTDILQVSVNHVCYCDFVMIPGHHPSSPQSVLICA